MADEIELIPAADWTRSVLFQGLPLHTSRKKLKKIFGEKLEEVTFIIRRDKVTYTRCCVLRMSSQAVADSILKRSYYKFDDMKVHIERYQGNQHHLEIYEEGAYKMNITGVEGKNDWIAYKHLEKAFQPCSFTDIVLVRGDDKIMTGVAEVSFRTMDGAKKAKEIAEGLNLGWEVTSSELDDQSRYKSLVSTVQMARLNLKTMEASGMEHRKTKGGYG